MHCMHGSAGVIASVLYASHCTTEHDPKTGNNTSEMVMH